MWLEPIIIVIVGTLAAMRIYALVRPLIGYKCPQCQQAALMKATSIHEFKEGWLDVYCCPSCAAVFKRPWTFANLRQSDCRSVSSK
jgi:hypothetical protein